MSKIFAITSANETAKLTADRHGEAAFTVTNTTARPMRGLAKLKPLGDTKQEWLKLKGESERDFVAGGTQQYTVMLDVPANAAPGKYGFRLDIVSTINPDEDFTEGPTVTAELSPPKPRPASKAWIIPVALIVVAVIVGAIVFLATRKKTVTVPPLEGQKIEQARELLTNAQLKFTEVQVPAPDLGQVGTVKSAAPKEGETVERDSTVTLEVYGKGAVKKVLGSTLEQARQILEKEQFLKVEVVKDPMPSLDYKEGQVADQSPGEGTLVEPGSPVKLTLAGATVKVPSGIKGQDLLTAVRMILDAKLKLEEKKGVVGDQWDGTVLRVEPDENKPVLEGTEITLYIPEGPCVSEARCARILQGLTCEFIKRGLLADRPELSEPCTRLNSRPPAAPVGSVSP
jgi:beta-lactam-binding protein with PASTA domain